MSDKHLQKGDERPPFTGLLRLYAMRFCPYVHRVVLVLNSKQISHEKIFVNLNNKPDWLTAEVNPLGSVPALEIEKDVIISDSNIINEYLELKYPEIPLMSSDPLRRARDRLIVEHFAPTQSAFYPAAFTTNDSTADQIERFFKGLNELQKQLLERKTTFIHGNEPGWVDFTIWPWLERIEALPLVGRKDFTLEPAKYETLLAYMAAMKNLPAVKMYKVSPEEHAKFMETQRAGAADYDILGPDGGACCFRPRKKKE